MRERDGGGARKKGCLLFAKSLPPCSTPLLWFLRFREESIDTIPSDSLALVVSGQEKFSEGVKERTVVQNPQEKPC